MIELLLYAALAGIFLTTVSQMYDVYLQTRIKAQVIAEVEQQGAQALGQMTQLIRNSERITNPIVGSSGSSLVLDVFESGSNPTTINESSGKLQVCEGDSCGAIGLTGSNITVSNLSFENLSGLGTPGVVKIEFMIDYAYTGERVEFQYEKVFYATATVRS